MKKLVNIKELKANHSDVYDTHYQKYCTAQWDFPLEVDWYKDMLNEIPWLDVHEVHYNVGYSQGDYAYFTGCVRLLKFLDEKDTENEYFVLREAIKLKEACHYMTISQSYRSHSGTARFNEIEWYGYDEWFDDPEKDDVVEGDTILAGMPYGEFYGVCMELLGDLYTWVKEVCEQRMNKLYWEIREDIDHQMSEESFEEWAEAMDEQFEVEIDDDEPRDADHSEDARMAA